MTSPFDPNKKVALFVTCLVDAMRPSVGFAAMKLLADAGAHVVVPDGQTCCGQPALNSGDAPGARRVAKNMIRAFAGYDYVVAPSGSCAATVVRHYPELFRDDKKWLAPARALAGRTYELTTFLVDVMGVENTGAHVDGAVAYHDSCSGLRELSIHDQPRKLLANVAGLEIREPSTQGTCCGFGGLFSVKMGDVSGAIVSDKADDLLATNAGIVSGGDLGCLINIAGRLSRSGNGPDDKDGAKDGIRVYHVAEILAGMLDAAPIGAADNGGNGGGKQK